MPEMKVNTETQRENPRKALRAARQAHLKLASAQRPTAKVYAANEEMRRVLRHPNGLRFRAELDQAVEWPHDSFTARRIADGSVRTDGPGSGNHAEPDPKLNARERAAARREKPQPKPPSDQSASPSSDQPQEPKAAKPKA